MKESSFFLCVLSFLSFYLNQRSSWDTDFRSSWICFLVFYLECVSLRQNLARPIDIWRKWMTLSGYKLKSCADCFAQYFFFPFCKKCVCCQQTPLATKYWSEKLFYMACHQWSHFVSIEYVSATKSIFVTKFLSFGD